MKANDIRKGAVIYYEGKPHLVMDFTHRTPGNLRAFVQVRLRTLKSGMSLDHRFSATENVEDILAVRLLIAETGAGPARRAFRPGCRGWAPDAPAGRFAAPAARRTFSARSVCRRPMPG